VAHITRVSLHVVVVCASPDANVKRGLDLWLGDFGFRQEIAPTVTYVIDVQAGIGRRLLAQYREKIGTIRRHPQWNFYCGNCTNAFLINGRTRDQKNKRRQLPHSATV